jgi:hypothetical protein
VSQAPCREVEADDCPSADEDTPRSAGRGAQGRSGRGGKPGNALEDRNRQQLYEIEKDRNISGRSKMGKWELIAAIRRSR